LDIPRIVIAGTHSGVGKTLLAAAIMKGMVELNMKVQPFKVGPDYIDPGYHTEATGNISRNLDFWLVGENGIKELFTRSAAGADISVIEGVMGLFDGIGSRGEGSTAHIACLLEAPVILVADVRSMSRSAAAMILGYREFEPKINLMGVILNRVGSKRHYSILKEAIESTTGVKVLGALEYDPQLELTERHLGLMPSRERNDSTVLMEDLSRRICHNLDIKGIIQLAAMAPKITPVKTDIFKPEESSEYMVNLGLVVDDAFNFYYQDSLDYLTFLGAEIIPCSALKGGLPSDLDGLYIGGGFPEIFAEEISGNREFIEDIRARHKEGMPIYAECGGMMFLSQSITDFEGREHPMAGIIPAKTLMMKKRAGLGYVSAISRKNNILAGKNQTLQGHEFHYSILEGHSIDDCAYILKKSQDKSNYDGYAKDNVLASYLHLHFCGCREQGKRFIASCKNYQTGKRSNIVDNFSEFKEV
jgi:cobyrinic acid a,c-diamide synthase